MIVTVWSDFSSFLLSDRRAERVAASVGSSSGATGWILQVPIVSLSENFDFLKVCCQRFGALLTLFRCFLLSPKLNVSFLIVSFVCDYKGGD